jgi:hypothetical protein
MFKYSRCTDAYALAHTELQNYLSVAGSAVLRSRKRFVALRRHTIKKLSDYKLYTLINSGARGSVVVKVICYKLEGRGFDS